MTRINDNGIDREMTTAEQTQYDAWVEIWQKEQTEKLAALEIVAAAKASARAKLAALGLTDDEIAALLGA